jgi:hypothetical protein
MRYYQRAGGPGEGLFPEEQRHIPMWNRTGSILSPGHIVQVDEQKADAASTTMTPGAVGSAYANVIVPTAGTALCGGTFMVYEGPGTCADDAKGLFALVGIIDCDIEDGAVALTDVLVPQATLELDRHAALTTLTDGQKWIAKPQATRASGGALVSCFFNGYGFATSTTT